MAQKNNTMIVPGNMSEVSALIGTAMALMKAASQSGERLRISRCIRRIPRRDG